MSLDHNLFYFVNRSLSCRALDWLSAVLTPLGDKRVLAVFLAVLIIASKGLLRRTAVLSLISFSVSLFFVAILKNVFARPRPVAVLLDARVLHDAGMTNSFPSGHTTLAFAVACVFALKYPKLIFPLLMTAAMVGFVRVYSGVHFPSDVLAGAALGSAAAFIVVFIEGKVFKKKSAT